MKKTRLETDYEVLLQEVNQLSQLTIQAYEQTLLALKTLDLEIALTILKKDQKIDNLSEEIVEEATIVIIRQQPVASDLRKILMIMRKKLMILCALCCASFAMSAQTNSWAQKLVNNIAADVSISVEQTEPLQSVVDVYIAAVQQANEQYTDDTERTKAKETIYQTFQTSLQEVLTAEQYAELMRVREERRNQRLTH